MIRRTAILVVAVMTGSLGSSYAQQCLHGAAETAAETTRRNQALTATRTINNIQANQPGAASGLYLRHVELAGAPYAMGLPNSTSETIRRISLRPDADVLPNWQLTLDVTQTGYWFMVADKTDPCGFTYISNQDGIIYAAEFLR